MDRRSSSVSYIEDMQPLTEGQRILKSVIEQYNSFRPKSLHINSQAIDLRDAARLFVFIESCIKDAMRIESLKEEKGRYIEAGKALIEMGYQVHNAENLVREVSRMTNTIENATEDELIEALKKRLDNKGPAEAQAIINSLRGNTEIASIEPDPNNTDADSNDYLINRSSWLKAVNDNDEEIVMHVRLNDSSVAISMFTGPELEYLDNESASVILDFEPKNAESPH